MTQLIRSIITDISEGEIKRFSGQGRIGERFLNREYFQHYGLTSRPLPGAEGIALIRGNVVYLIASDDRRYRIELAAGEVALYDSAGDKVHLKQGSVEVSTPGKVTIDSASEVEITAPSAKITAQTATITAPTTTVQGNLNVNGNIFATGTVVNAAGDVLHHH